MRRRQSEVWWCDVELFLISVVILFLELVLIRWLGTEIRVFAYLGNLLLVVCFFGVGLGCYLAGQPVALYKLGVNVLLLVLLVANPLGNRGLNLSGVTFLLSRFEDSPLWNSILGGSWYQVVGALVIVAGLLYLVVTAFLPVGQMLGRVFGRHPHIIRAYSVNVAGSLAGVWLFDLLCWRSLPPAVWFALLTLILGGTVLLAAPRQWVGVVAVGLSAVLLAIVREPGQRTVWTPYHKFTLRPFVAAAPGVPVPLGYLLEVSGTFHQHMQNLSPEFVRQHATVLNPELVRRSHYNLPFAFKPAIDRALIVGAGSGNNAAAALRHGVGQVDCVEIDPGIYAVGQELHPEHPYSSPRVTMVIEDARAYFKNARGRSYDLVWFAVLDSHVLGSSYNNLRLDHYVYTLESLTEAKRLLSADGILVLSFAAERAWIADRLFVMLRQVFGHDPLAYEIQDVPLECGGGGLSLVCSKQRVTVDSLRDPMLREFVRAHLVTFPATTRPTTDDWPYLYLERAKIPKLHLVISLAILGAVAFAGRRRLGMQGAADWHFFALGAAFLLLEVQTVSRATLLFGMTWVVNAIVISAVLVMILLANLAAWRWPRFPQWLVVTGLALTVSLLALVPLDWFNSLAGPTKLVAASAFLTAPIFFSGLMFIRSFAASTDKSRALGANLIGALVGGLLESLSFVTGIRALVVLVGLFYAVAVLLRPKTIVPISPTVSNSGPVPSGLPES